MPNTAFLCRRPILDVELNSFGYEVRYRYTGASSPHEQPATETALSQLLLDWDTSTILGDRFAFVDTDPTEIANGVHECLPPESAILQIDANEALAAPPESLERARSAGYHFAIRNLHLCPDPAAATLGGIARIATGELAQLEVLDLVHRIKRVNPAMILLADRVDTAQAFAMYRSEGFDLFHGDFFTQPEEMSRTSHRSGSTAAMALLARLNDPAVTLLEAEELLQSDPALTFRILAAVNSSAFGLGRRVESLRQAVVLAGLGQIRHLALLMSVCVGPTVSEELVALGATRGRFLASLERDEEARNRAFTMGLLSVADAIFSRPMAELVEELPLTDDVIEALVHGTGPLGASLDMARTCEMPERATEAQIARAGAARAFEMYAKARSWGDELRDDLPADLRRTSGVQVPQAPEMAPTS